MKCCLCPRNCLANRENSVGFCGAKDKMRVAKVMLHEWEEPILTKGSEKSGAIFFSGCNLRCIYCQNYAISHGQVGDEISEDELVEIFKDLEKSGAGNIDLVTPTHFAHHIIGALKKYKPKVPVIYNTSGYEKVETLKALEGLVDIFLTDYKYASSSLSEELSGAKDYPEVIEAALKEMKRQQPENVFENDKLTKGIVVRHLVLPNCVKDSLEVLEKIHSILGENAIVSIMSQYTPMGEAAKKRKINRKITKLEYKIVVNRAIKLNLLCSLVQDLESADSCYTPTFNKDTKNIK